MRLSPQDTARFYRSWFALLRYVNEQRRLVASFPAAPNEAAVAPADALTLREALWADDALRNRFVAENPAGLPPVDLALVDSWQHRVPGNFFIERYLKKHAIFLSESTPMRAYGVLGLVSSIEEVVGFFPPPVYVQAVLLPFEGKIIYDSLLSSHPILFGPGIRAELKDGYRDAQEREGIITSLPPDASADPGAMRANARSRNGKLLGVFRKHLARSGLGPATVERHVGSIGVFAESYLLAQDPPRGLLALTPADIEVYLGTGDTSANRVSFKRFVRFLMSTGRLDAERAADLYDLFRRA